MVANTYKCWKRGLETGINVQRGIFHRQNVWLDDTTNLPLQFTDWLDTEPDHQGPGSMVNI